MGTIINGNKWAGACVNGNVVSGLVKNGVVFYKKNQQELYKRRIVIGDNLSYKTIYCDFPENYYQIISEEIGMGNQRRVIISDVQTTYIVENNLSPNFEVRVINGVQWQNNIYNYQNGNLITNLTSLSLENFGSVVTINNNQAYRHIYIEDPNIRLLKVGDVITENTKFYFTFPDDFYNYIKSTVDTSGRSDEVIIVELDNDNELDHLSLWYNALTDSSKAYCVRMSGNYYSTMEDAYQYIERTSPLLINKSIMTGTEIGNFVGTVTMIDKTNEAYQHILVDTTTLGA